MGKPLLIHFGDNMFERLKQRKAEVHRRHAERRSEWDRQGAESTSLVNNIYTLIDSGKGRGRDYWEQLTSYSDRTLVLLLDAFGTDPNGVIRILLESGENKDAETFIKERIRYPIVLGMTNFGTVKTYREARACLGVPDLSALPADKNDGVCAVLTVSAFWGKRYMEDEYQTDGDEGQMEPQLASLLMEMPYRSDDIIDYIKERKVTLKELDVPHLREALSTDIKSLSSGVL